MPGQIVAKGIEVVPAVRGSRGWAPFSSLPKIHPGRIEHGGCWCWDGSGCGAENAVDTSCLCTETLEEIIIIILVIIMGFCLLSLLASAVPDEFLAGFKPQHRIISVPGTLQEGDFTPINRNIDPNGRGVSRALRSSAGAVPSTG